MNRSGQGEDFLQAALVHADVVHALARRLAPHPQDAPDIVQETYLRGYAAWGRRRPDDVGAWLATICLNVGRDALRRHARHNTLLDDRPAPDLPSAVDTADAALERLGNDRIESALWTLPEVQRIAITLMDICGFTAAQVATITAAPRGTVLARVHRGRKTLALILTDERAEQRQPREVSDGP
ncbi:RNA polymerase sigma factor [Kineosporia sp. R_H_3]|uniref:RNA polymerase sigma factor n=1 Tax=Kineosporia sp. R_H_3 TaxID=1961848 RepID=UPI000B4B0A06|nr:sigma-70 family RNA polymerase sigma factor [Kineosporia sp. R_H_3]